MSERVPCRECGASILSSTAEKTGGICMPCKSGTRKDIEASKARHEQDKIYRESSEWKHWLWLVDKVDKSEGGFSSLSHPNQLYFATRLVDREVHNGGFDQYFFNSSAHYFNFAVEGLNTIGASESLRLLFAAKNVLFGRNEVPLNTRDRREFLRLIDEDTQSSNNKALNILDNAFCADPDDFDDLMNKFAKCHDLHKNF